MRKAKALTLLALLVPAPVFAQAWLPSAGMGTISVIYQNMEVKDHLSDTGLRVQAGHITSNNLLLDVSYGLTNRMALNVSLPYIASRYTGDLPHPYNKNGGAPYSALDNGAYHGSLQDFHVTFRYGLIGGGSAVTPFVNLIVPSHRYDYFGHAAPGRRLAEVQIGLYAGHVFAGRFRRTFVQTRYSYGFSEQPLGEYHDRSNVEAEIGYFVNPRFRVFVLSSNQYTHGGVALPINFRQVLTQAEYLHHDQIARANLADMGTGAQFSLTPRVDVFFSYATTLAGQNGHALNRGLSLGMAWTFGGPHAADPLAERTRDALPRCLCQKGSSGQ